MICRPRVPAAAMALTMVVVLTAACTGAGTTSSAPSFAPGPTTTGPGPAGTGRSPLCRYPKPNRVPPDASPAPLPAAIREVADQVGEVRQLSWERAVSPEGVSQERLGQILTALTARSLPAAQLALESRAWITIGALAPGTSLRSAMLAYAGSEVVGFYDTLSRRLVFSGSTSPTPYQRYVLSHELTHALDDQRFDLSRMDRLQYRCQDEQLEALSSLAEGDAVANSNAWARRFLSDDELSALQQEASKFPPPPSSVPPFVQQLEQFPYPNGLAFVNALQARGGEAAVDAAFRNPPVSTAQILHPEKYPTAVPVPLTVIKPRSLDSSWRLIGQMEVGEAWLRILLGLRISTVQAESAAAGWGGGEYEAWANGTRTVVRMITVWDTRRDASQFESALRSFADGRPVTVETAGTRVTATFGSNPAALRAAGAG
jgi:hypothetical protein